MVDGNFIEIYENAVPDALCDRIVEKHGELLTNSSAFCDDSDFYGGPQKRKDTCFYFELDAVNLASELNVALDSALVKYADKYPSLGMLNFYSRTCKVQCTPPKGGFHLWHCESGPNDSRCRILVWMVYLNDVPEGEGTTEFIEQGVVLQPKKGSLVLFPASWTHTHRGNPVYTQDKYIATGWYYQVDPT